MEIPLPRELEQLINDKVATGKYISANEVVGEALRLLQERDELRRMEAEIVMSQVQQLSAEQQLELIKRVTEVLNNVRGADEHRQLVYGEFKGAGGRESTEADFKLAEWRPSEEWLNGE